MIWGRKKHFPEMPITSFNRKGRKPEKRNIRKDSKENNGVVGKEAYFVSAPVGLHYSHCTKLNAY